MPGEPVRTYVRGMILDGTHCWLLFIVSDFIKFLPRPVVLSKAIPIPLRRRVHRFHAKSSSNHEISYMKKKEMSCQERMEKNKLKFGHYSFPPVRRFLHPMYPFSSSSPAALLVGLVRLAGSSGSDCPS